MENTILEDDILIVRIAREIALDHYELGDILKRYSVTVEQWERISKDRYFRSVLASEIAEWNATSNTGERSKLKAAALIEEWLPEANARLHDAKENLTAKVALATLVTKISGMGISAANIEGGGGERFVVNINLGEQKSLHVNKQLTPALPIIDVTPEHK